MTTLLTMLPFYLLGNLHCIGMCGPLVMMLGHHRYRYFYFLGRTLSFTLAGMAAGEAGALFHFFLQQYHISAVACFLFGGIISLIGLFTLTGHHYPGYNLISKKTTTISQTLSLLVLKDRMWPTFLFGFFTVALPCGQSLIVFSACALSGSLWIGMVNGFAFALLTSPSLFFAMRAHSFLSHLKKHYQTILGILALIVGTLTFCRGLADLQLIPHLVLNVSSEYHIVIY